MNKERHSINKGYGYNYIFEASHCYWAARTFELRKSTDDKEKIIDELLIRRLRQMAEVLMEQGIHTLSLDTELDESDKAALIQQAVPTGDVK